MPRRSARVAYLLLSALLLVLAAAAETSTASLNAQSQHELLSSEGGFQAGTILGESSDGSAAMAAVDRRQSWGHFTRNLAHRIFQIVNDDEKNHWPTLKLGWRTVSAVILGGIGAALSSAGGIGGGGLFVPLFNLLLQFDAKTSAALSNFMILGGALSNLYINLQQRHPTKPEKPLIDFEMVLLMQPNMLLGISMGVILNVMLPDWAITALLTITLSYMTGHSCKGGIRRWKKETQQNRSHRRKSYDGSAPDFLHHRSSSSDDSSADGDGDSSSADEESPNPEGDGTVVIPSKLSGETPEWSMPLLDKESSKSSRLPLDKILGLLFTWLAFFAVQVLRGGRGSESILGIEPCGWGYWLLTATQIPLALGVSAWTVRCMRRNHCSKAHPGAIQEEGFEVTPETCTLFAWLALVAGLLGGLLGIGGGMIVNPLLLTVGMVPQVTAGTCASMVFFSSSMSVVQFWLMGRVPLQYALIAALLCAIFSFVGITLVHRLIDKYNRASLIVFIVATVMGVSALLMGGFGGVGVWQQYESGAYMGFHRAC